MLCVVCGHKVKAEVKLLAIQVGFLRRTVLIDVKTVLRTRQRF
jgi:hypothetical protein